MVKILVEAKVDVNVVYLERTPLAHLCEDNRDTREIMKYLIDNKADMNLGFF